jgi:hypothetical protein
MVINYVSVRRTFSLDIFCPLMKRNKLTFIMINLKRSIKNFDFILSSFLLQKYKKFLFKIFVGLKKIDNQNSSILK